MKFLSIRKLTLKDWRAQNRVIEFNHDITRIYAKNGIGKTSIQQAWMWLMTGRTDPNHNANFNLFDDKELTTKDTPAASVEAEVSINGNAYTLKRTARSKYVKERGKDTYVKAASDEYKLYIDEVETSVSSWNTFIENNMCPKEMLPYIMSGEFFGVLSILDKNKAREILLKISDEVRDSDFKGDYSIFNEYLEKNFNVDMIEESATKKIKKVNERQEEITNEIRSKQEQIAEYKQIDFDAIKEKVEKKTQEIKEIDGTILGLSESVMPLIKERDSILVEVNKKLSSLGDKRIAYESDYKQKVAAIKSKINNVEIENNRIERRNNDLRGRIKSIDNEITSSSKQLNILRSEREQLIQQINEVKARVFDGYKCAYCGQELLDEQIEVAKSKFNEQKEREIEIIKGKGKLVRSKIDRLDEEIKDLKEKKASMPEEEHTLDCREFNLELEKLKNELVPYENTEEYGVLNKEIEDLRASMPKIEEHDNKALTDKKDAMMDELAELNKELGLESQIEKLEKYIKKLQEEFHDNGIEIAKNEQVQQKVKEYRQERNSIATSRVNANLDGCYFDIFSFQKDGRQVDDLVLKASDGVQYATINNSKRMKMNIQLQKMFMDRFELKMPIFVDEVQSFDSENTPKFKEQGIFLYVSDDKQLIVK